MTGRTMDGAKRSDFKSAVVVHEMSRAAQRASSGWPKPAAPSWCWQEAVVFQPHLISGADPGRQPSYILPSSSIAGCPETGCLLHRPPALLQ